MKKSSKFISLLLSFGMVLSTFSWLAACGDKRDDGKKDEGNSSVGTLSYETEMLSEAEDVSYGYNNELFYVNTLEFQIADPTVIQITEGEEKGYFYAYGTSDEIQCHGFQAWRSKDLSHWECMGVAFQPDYSNTWAVDNYWAPEIIYDEGEKLYYLFYNAFNQNDGGRLWLSVAYSKHPAGPFVAPDGRRDANGNVLTADKPVYNVTASNPALQKLWEEKKAEDPTFNADFIKEQALDASPFIDPDTGKKYLYFSYYDNYGVGSFVYGMEMKNWFTPDYSTLTMLTYPGYLSLEGAKAGKMEERVTEGSVNEGPFMVKYNGKYYLTLSIFGYTDPNYRVIQAISDDPLGSFRKVEELDGGKVISSSTDWSHIVSAGHHCFIRCGEELFIAYHTFKDRNSIAGGRALAVDKVVWTKNSQGVDVMHTNGPTWSVQALPESVSGYKNIAPLATVTANNTAEDSDVAFLTDEIIKYQEYDLAEEYTANEGKSTIKLEWEKAKTARAIMIFNSYDYLNTFVEIEKVEFEYMKKDGTFATATIEDLPYDWDWHFESDYEFVRPGGAAIAEFNEMPVKSVTITVASAGGAEALALGEIVVLGKDKACAGVEKFEEYKYPEPVKCGSSHIVNTSKTFGNIAEAKASTMYGYDLSHDDGTEGAYIEQKGVRDQYAYFNNVHSTSFYAEAEFTVTADSAFANDPYPKFGIAMTCGGSYPNTIFFYVDAVNYVNTSVGCAQRTLDNSNWDWDATEQIVNVPGIQYKNEKYVKLAVLRNGNEFYLLCEDKVAIYYDSFNIFTDSMPSAVGFLTFNTPLKIKNYFASQDEEVVKQKTAQYAAFVNGDTFGKAGNYSTTTGWDLFSDNGENPTVTNSLGGDQYAYFKDINDTTFYVETEISVTKDMGDPYPKFGLALRTSENTFFFYIDGSGKYTSQKVGYVNRLADGTNWDWGNGKEQAVNLGKYDEGEYVKLGLLREGNTIKLFVNDVLVFTVTDVPGFGENDSCVAAVLAFTTGVTIRNYSATTDVSGVEA